MMGKREALAAEVGAVLADADADIAARRPVCRASGRCCHFEAYGHRLYVTAAELVYFESRVERGKLDAEGGTAKVSLPQFFAGEKVEGCPYQVGGLCTEREARPLGCRIYFCDANAQGWQAEVYETYHQRLRALHEKHDLPYAYLEWRDALRSLPADAGQF